MTSRCCCDYCFGECGRFGKCLFGVQITIHLVLWICSVVAHYNYKEDISDGYVSGLLAVCLSILLYAVIGIEQCIPAECGTNNLQSGIKGVMVLGAFACYVVILAYLINAYKGDEINPNVKVISVGIQFAINTVKADTILFGIIGIPTMLYYFWTSCGIVCNPSKVDYDIENPVMPDPSQTTLAIVATGSAYASYHH